MTNCLLITDYNWDNMGLISKRLSYLSEDVVVNLLYSPQKTALIKMCNYNDINVFRRSESDKVKITNSIDFCMIFTDFLEYNTNSDFFTDICSRNNIPYLTFSNSNEMYYLNGELCKNKFKKTLIKILETKNRNKVDKSLVYKEIVSYKRPKKETSFEEVSEKLRNAYVMVTSKKEKRSIIVIDPSQI
tara:strand:+ start:18958 stop:19521 length:564 start_codon:yes stop_codon:yes gene_type:complete